MGSDSVPKTGTDSVPALTISFVRGRNPPPAVVGIRPNSGAGIRPDFGVGNGSNLGVNQYCNVGTRSKPGVGIRPRAASESAPAHVEIDFVDAAFEPRVLFFYVAGGIRKGRFHR